MLYQALFHELYVAEAAQTGQMTGQVDVPSIVRIVHNLSVFYHQIWNKVDKYQGIVDKGKGLGQFAGAISGLSSLSLMSILHPLVGIAAVPFSIQLGSSL